MEETEQAAVRKGEGDEEGKKEEPNEISIQFPIRDFKKMVEFRYKDLTEPAILKMIEVVRKLLKESFKGSLFEKAVKCVKVLREVCVDQDEGEMFNEFMQKAADEFGVKEFYDLWKLMQDEGVLMISCEETDTSVRSSQECKEFFERMTGKDVILSSKKDDDLLDELE